MHRLRTKLTFANVLSCLALFLALCGASYAATQIPKNSVGTSQIKGSAVTPAKLSSAAKAGFTGPQGIKGPTGDQGPKGEPGQNGSPDTPQQVLEKLKQVDGEGSGLDAELLGGSGAGAFVKADAATFTTALPDECSFVGSQWASYDGHTVGYYRDPLGFVHLEGIAFAQCLPTDTIFTLPAGYRPEATSEFPVTVADYDSILPPQLRPLEINSGAVGLGGGFGSLPGQLIDLSGISFRCGPSGSDGCP